MRSDNVVGLLRFPAASADGCSHCQWEAVNTDVMVSTFNEHNCQATAVAQWSLRLTGLLSVVNVGLNVVGSNDLLNL